MCLPDDFCFSADVVEISEHVLMPAFLALRNHFIEWDCSRSDDMIPVRITLPTALQQAEALLQLRPPDPAR